MVLVVLCHALLVLITAGFGILVGRGAPFLDQLLLLFDCPPRSSGALLAGSLPLRYCSSKFSSRTPFWDLPVPGHVAELITVEDHAALVGEVGVACRGVGFLGVSRFGKKRFRLNRKTRAHLVVSCMHARPRVEEVALFWVSGCFRC